jgi:putative membrane protein insertion efficiency factor
VAGLSRRGATTRTRRIVALAGLLLVALVALDLRRPPSNQLAARLALGGIHLYQATLSRWYAAAGVQCRFTPTCSRYAEACVRELGAARGSWLALRRVVRCGPWTPAGTVDEPPIPRSPNLPISQSPNLPISQSPNLPISQSLNLSISQSLNPPIPHPSRPAGT